MSETVWIIVAVASLLLTFVFWVQASDLKKRQENLRKEMEKLKFRNTDLETHQRKFELKPHTLKNILANIKAMSNQISRSMDSLSFLLEYIFENNENHFATVKDEVDFIKGYIVLQENFTVGIKNVQLDVSLIEGQNPFYEKPVIPHLITAYLIENAFKHGDSSHPEFLAITIKLQGDFFEIEVRNKVRKEYNSEHVGIGLSNMKSRLRHLKDGKHTYVASRIEDEYHVKLTLKLK